MFSYVPCPAAGVQLSMVSPLHCEESGFEPGE